METSKNILANQKTILIKTDVCVEGVSIKEIIYKCIVQ